MYESNNAPPAAPVADPVVEPAIEPAPAAEPAVEPAPAEQQPAPEPSPAPVAPEEPVAAPEAAPVARAVVERDPDLSPSRGVKKERRPHRRTMAKSNQTPNIRPRPDAPRRPVGRPPKNASAASGAPAGGVSAPAASAAAPGTPATPGAPTPAAPGIQHGAVVLPLPLTVDNCAIGRGLAIQWMSMMQVMAVQLGRCGFSPETARLYVEANTALFAAYHPWFGPIKMAVMSQITFVIPAMMPFDGDPDDRVGFDTILAEALKAPADPRGKYTSALEANTKGASKGA